MNSNHPILDTIEAHPSRIAALAAFLDSQGWSSDPFEPVASAGPIIMPTPGTVTMAFADAASSDDLDHLRAVVGMR